MLNNDIHIISLHSLISHRLHEKGYFNPQKNENLERSLTDFKMAKYVPGTTGRVSVEEDLVEDTEEDSVEEEEDCLSKYLDLHCKCH